MSHLINALAYMNVRGPENVLMILVSVINSIYDVSGRRQMAGYSTISHAIQNKF